MSERPWKTKNMLFYTVNMKYFFILLILLVKFITILEALILLLKAERTGNFKLTLKHNI
jgi:hypothetical protein